MCNKESCENILMKLAQNKTNNNCSLVMESFSFQRKLRIIETVKIYFPFVYDMPEFTQSTVDRKFI